MNPSTNEATKQSERGKRWPTWRFVLSMVRFRPGLWLIDLAAKVVGQLCWGVAAGLVMRAFINLLTGETPVRLGI